MSILKHPLFLGISIISIAIYFAKIADFALPNWIYFYLSNLLCMPFVFSLCLAAVRFINRDDTLYIPIGAILALTAYYAIYFEWILPQYNLRYTADFIDVILYSIGSGLFYIFQKRVYK